MLNGSIHVLREKKEKRNKKTNRFCDDALFESHFHDSNDFQKRFGMRETCLLAPLLLHLRCSESIYNDSVITIKKKELKQRF